MAYKKQLKHIIRCNVSHRQSHRWDKNDAYNTAIKQKHEVWKNAYKKERRNNRWMDQYESSMSKPRSQFEIFSLCTMGSGKPFIDWNTIIDEGAPKFIGRIAGATRMRGFLAKNFKIHPSLDNYRKGWDKREADAKPVIVTWNIFVLKSHGNPTTMIFDLTSGKAPLILLLDVLRRGTMKNLARQLAFKLDQDSSHRKFCTYIAQNEDGNKHIRLELLCQNIQRRFVNPESKSKD